LGVNVSPRRVIRHWKGELLNQPDVYAEIQEIKPKNPVNGVHLYYSEEIAGWWEEPAYSSNLINKNKHLGLIKLLNKIIMDFI